MIRSATLPNKDHIQRWQEIRVDLHDIQGRPHEQRQTMAPWSSGLVSVLPPRSQTRSEPIMAIMYDSEMQEENRPTHGRAVP